MRTTSDAIEPEREEAMLTADQVATLLRVSKEWVRRSSLPVVALGRARRYRLADIERHVEASLSRSSPRSEL